jgi:hypothetical protein
MAILQSLTTFRLLFIYFFSCVYTGYYSDPVPAALKAEGAAGGGGPAIAPPPGPRFHQSLSSVSCVSCVSTLLLSTGKGIP